MIDAILERSYRVITSQRCKIRLVSHAFIEAARDEMLDEMLDDTYVVRLAVSVRSADRPCLRFLGWHRLTVRSLNSLFHEVLDHAHTGCLVELLGVPDRLRLRLL